MAELDARYNFTYTQFLRRSSLLGVRGPEVLIRTPDFAKRASASLQKSRLVFTGFRGLEDLLWVLQRV